MRKMKKVLFDNFQVFFIVFDHVNTCASIRSLVEKYNIQYFQGFANISYCYLMSIFRKNILEITLLQKVAIKGKTYLQMLSENPWEIKVIGFAWFYHILLLEKEKNHLMPRGHYHTPW